MRKLHEIMNKIKGGLSDTYSLADIAKKHHIPLSDIQSELEIGIKVEMEHTRDKELAAEIAKDHLFELPDYYTRLKKIEK